MFRSGKTVHCGVRSSALLGVVREERDMHGRGLLEVVEIEPEPRLYRLQPTVQRGPRDVVQLRGT